MSAIGFDASGWTQAALTGLQEAAPDRVRLSSTLGPLEVSAHAEGVLRLRIGEGNAADYGLLAEPNTSGRLDCRSRTAPIRLDAGALGLDLEADPFRFTLTLHDAFLLESITDRHFTGRLRLPGLARGPGGWLVSLALRSGEPVYGLGEKFGTLDHRGQLILSRNEDALGVNTALSYKNIPFAWSPGGWGVFVNTPAQVAHAVGYAPWSHRSYALMVEDEALDLFLIAGKTPSDQIGRASCRERV